MSKQANKTIIGAFVMVAVALLIIAITIFGSGRFFSVRGAYVLYFGGSIKGLNVGAPVSFRGVKVGQVTDINVIFNPKDYSGTIEVFIETDPGRISIAKTETLVATITAQTERVNMMKELIAKRGLKAQLQLQSLVTGLLEVELDFYPGTPIRLVGTDPTQVEIPTVPSDMEKLQMTVSNAIAKFEKLPIDELMNNLVKAVNGIERLTNSPQITETLTSLNQTIQTVQVLVKNLDSRVGPITSNIDGGLKSARDALEQANKTLVAVEKVAGDTTTLRYQLSEALEQISDAARSLRVTADFIDQHPEAFIRGKEKPGGK
jgi:paraquat-inducible protein B